MTSKSFSKSEAFKEREKNAREKIRQVVKQDLVADLSRLFGDTTFSDVFFIVNNVEFQGHTIILRARAPNFCHHFLPSHASTVSVQTCIQIRGIEAAEFEAFLRSAYIDDDFQDYDESSYPWKRQSTTSDAQINDFGDGVCSQSNNVKPPDSQNDQHNNVAVYSIQNFNEHEDNTCTQSDCTSDLSSPDKTSDMLSHEDTVSSNIAMECNEKLLRPPNNEQVEDISKLSQCDPCTFASNVKKSSNTQSSSSPLLNDAVLLNDSSVFLASLSPEENTSQCDACDLVDSLDIMAVKESCSKFACKATQTSSDLATNGIFASLSNNIGNGEREPDEASCDLISDIENGIQAIQDHPDISAKQVQAHNEISKVDLENCSCKLGQDLLQLLADDSGSDITLLVNEEKVKAHKAILCARSNYFSAMLLGDWIEGKSNEIPLVGVNYSGLMTVLKYVYGGTARVENDLAMICDTLPLVDMYGLEGMREVIICTLKIEKCHLFHKPCSECVTGVFECLEASELFSLGELKNSCVKWITKHFDRVLGTRGFATLPKKLQEDVLAEIKSTFVISSAIDVLNQCDKLSSCTPLVKWTEPVHAAVSSIQESCLLFIASNFFALIDVEIFHVILKGVGWSIPVLEKIVLAVNKNLAIENCCDQLRAILKLKRLIKLRASEEGEDCYPEEVTDLVSSLHNDCVKFIRRNLFKVTRSQGWKNLNIITQREIKEGAIFSGLGGDSEDRRGVAKGGNTSKPASSSSRPTTARAVTQRAGSVSRARGLGRRSSATEGQPSKASNAGRASSARAEILMNKRRSSGQPSSAQGSNATPCRGKPPSSSKHASQKENLPSVSSVASGSSKSLSSCAKDKSDKRSCSVVGRGKTLPSKSSTNGLPDCRRTCYSLQKESVLTKSCAKKNILRAQGNSIGKPSSVVESSGAKKKQVACRPPLPRSNTDSKLCKNLKEKAVCVDGCRTQAKKAPTKTTVQPSTNKGHCREREAKGALASCNSNKLSTSKVVKDSSLRKELFRNVACSSCSTTSACKDNEQDITSQEDENSRRCSVGALNEASSNDCVSNSPTEDIADNSVGTQDAEAMISEDKRDTFVSLE